jgi:hypothetical protein
MRLAPILSLRTAHKTDHGFYRGLHIDSTAGIVFTYPNEVKKLQEIPSNSPFQKGRTWSSPFLKGGSRGIFVQSMGAVKSGNFFYYARLIP